MAKRITALRSALLTALIALGLAGVAPLTPATSASAAPDDTVVVDLLGINDFHGRIAESPGAVELASAVEDARAANPASLLVGAGDLFGASTFTSSIADDIPTTDALNALGLDVSSVGNHEFDQGYETLLARIDGTGAYAGHGLGWDYLGANVLLKDTHSPALAPHTIKQVATDEGDVRLGFIGLVTENTPLSVTPSGIVDLEFASLISATENSIAALKSDANPPDAIVVLVHEGGASAADVEDPQTPFGSFAAKLAATGDVAAIFSGHTHQAYVAEVDGMPVVQTGSHNQNLARVSLDFILDDDSHLSFSGASGAELISLADYPVATGNAVVDAVAAIVDAARSNADAVGQETVGKITADLNHTYHPTAESTLANLVADAQLQAAQAHTAPDLAPDIAFTNPGGVRTSITGDPNGDVTYAQVFETQPFANAMIAFDLTGAEVKAALEQQWPTGPASRDFYRLGVSGISYIYDPSAEQGERITRVVIGGEPLDEQRTYRAVMNNFLATGGDGFSVFAQANGRVDIGLIDTDIFIEHFENHSPISPDTRPRGIAATWISDPEKHYEPGDEIALDLGSLIFSTNEPKPDQLQLALVSADAGVSIEIGMADVDTTVSDEIRDIGRAQVRIEVPDLEGLGEAAEPWVLRISEPVNDYELDFDVQLMGAAVVAGPELPRTGGAPLELAGIGALTALAGVVLLTRYAAPRRGLFAHRRRPGSGRPTGSASLK